jgi:hypothetical protein
MWSEGFGDKFAGGGFGQGSSADRLKALAARLAAIQGQEQPVDTEAPAEEPDDIGPAAGEAPPAAPAGPSRTPSAKKVQGATRRQAGGTGDATPPPPIGRINKTPDPNDPNSPEAKAAMAGDEGARRLGGGRGASRHMQDAGGGGVVDIFEKINGMMRGHIIGKGEGAKRSDSTWAGLMQQILQGDYNDQLYEANPDINWKFNYDFGNHPIGAPWKAVVERSLNPDIPEFVFRPNTIKKAWKALWLLVGNDANTEQDPMLLTPRDRKGVSTHRPGAADKENYTMFRQKLVAGHDLATMDPETKATLLRALQFEKIMFSTSIAGMKMTVRELAEKFHKLVPSETHMDQQARERIGGEYLPTNQEMDRDVRAVIHLIQTALSGDERDNYSRFFSVQGGRVAKITPDTVVMINPPSAVAEAKEWMNIYGLMEHWGF